MRNIHGYTLCNFIMSKWILFAYKMVLDYWTVSDNLMQKYFISTHVDVKYGIDRSKNNFEVAQKASRQAIDKSFVTCTFLFDILQFAINMLRPNFQR